MKFKQFAGALLVALLCGSASAQDSKTLVDADVKKLSELLSKKIPWPPGTKVDAGKKEQIDADFAKEIERVKKAMAPTPLLKLEKSWDDIFSLQRVPLKSPTSLGSIQELKLSVPARGGKKYEFSYGLLLPKSYDSRKRYPLIVCLHDRGGESRIMNGPKYLEEVWKRKDAPEDREKFILVAPNMGSGAAGKDFHIEWGDALHYANVLAVVESVQTNYAVDNSRIYLEGTGDGAEFGWNLAMYKPHKWAAFAARSAVPRRGPALAKTLLNLKALPVSVFLRKGTPAEGKAEIRALVDAATAAGVPIVTVSSDALPEKEGRISRGSCESDPIPEVSAQILAAFAQKTREQAPKAVEFYTDLTGRDRAYWVKLMRYDASGTAPAHVLASVDAATNTIALTTENVEDVRLLLSDRVVDLDKPVKITINGKPGADVATVRSLDDFLAYYEGNAVDPGLMPTAIINVQVPVAVDSKPSGDKSKDN